MNFQASREFIITTLKTVVRIFENASPTKAGVFLALLFCIRVVPNMNWGVGLCNGCEPAAVGRSLAYGTGFSNPYAPLATGPTAHLNMLFPSIVGASLYVLDDEVLANNFLTVISVGSAAIFIGALPFCTCLLGMGVLPGVIGALIGISLPLLIAPAAETNHAALSALVVFALTIHFRQRNRISRVFLPASWAVLLHLCSSAFPVVLVSTCIGIFRNARTASLQALWISCGVLLIHTPWILRNYFALGAFVPFRTNLPLELNVSNNPCASFSFVQNLNTGCFQALHPNFNLAQAQTVRELGEVAYSRLKFAEFLHWISNQPSEFIRLTLQRTVAFWFPTDFGSYWLQISMPGSRLYSLILWLGTVLGFLGLRRLFLKTTEGFLEILNWSLLFPLVYYFIQSIDRYRYPILWTSLIPAGLFLEGILIRLTKSVEKSTDPDLSKNSSSN